MMPVINDEKSKQSAKKRNINDGQRTKKSNIKRTNGNNRPKAKNKSTKRKRTIFSKSLTFALVMALACVLIVFVAINYRNLAPDRIAEWAKESMARIGGGDGYPYAINSNTIVQMEKLDEDIAILTESSLIILGPNAKELCNRQHGFANPAMDVKDDRFVVYDQGGKDFRVENRSQVLFEKSMDDNIIRCDLGIDGNVAVATSSDRSASKLTVFTRNFAEDFVWSSSSFHIIDMTLNAKGNSIAVALSGAKDGSVMSRIYVLDFDKEDPAFAYEEADNIFVSINYTNSGNLIAIGDKAVSIIKSKDYSKKEISYNGGQLKRGRVNLSGYGSIVYSKYDSGNLNTALMFDEKGKVYFQQDFTNAVLAADCDKDYMALLTNGEIYSVNNKSDTTKAIEVGRDAHDILVYGGDAYVLGIGEINKISLS